MAQRTISDARVTFSLSDLEFSDADDAECIATPRAISNVANYESLGSESGAEAASETSEFSGFSEVEDPRADPLYEVIERIRSATPVEDPEKWTRITPQERDDIDRGVMTEQVVLMRRLTRMTASTAPLLRALIHTLEALVRAQEESQKEVCECLRMVAAASRSRP